MQPVLLEPMFTVRQVAKFWQLSSQTIRKLLRGRQGVVNLSGNPGRPIWRVPASVVIEVMVERGYTREQADRILQAAVLADN